MSSSEFNAQSNRGGVTHGMPTRRRWRKWISLVLGIFAVVIVVLFFGWSQYAENRLQAEIDRITSSGEPLFPDDFNSPPIPDRDNAAVLYEKAAQLIDKSGVGKSSRINDCLNLAVDNDGLISTCGALVVANKEALALGHEARDRPEVFWSLEFKSPLLDHILPDLSSLRALGKLLRIKAELDHLHQHDGDAVRNIEDILTLSAAIDRQPTLISHLVALATEAQALYAIEKIGSRLAVGDGDDSAVEESADRTAVKHLIVRLLDDETLIAAMVRAFYCERAIQLDSVFMVSSGRVSMNGLTGPGAGQKGRSWLQTPLIPLFSLDGAAMLEHMSLQIEAVQSPTLPGYREHLAAAPAPPWSKPATGLQRFRHVVSRVLFPSLSRAVQLHYRLLDHRRMAATALAIRLYEIDHGQRPKILDALVPDYLPQVPADTMSSNGVIQYLPDAEYPRLYSVGSNGLDDGGAYGYRPSGTINWDVLDTPFFLDGPPPPPNGKDADETTP